MSFEHISLSHSGVQNDYLIKGKSKIFSGEEIGAVSNYRFIIYETILLYQVFFHGLSDSVCK